MVESKTVNISISNSSVGVLSTGDLASVSAINSGLSLLRSDEQAEIGTALRELTEAVLSDRGIPAELRRSSLETLEVLVEQASLPAEKRLKPGALATLLNGIGSVFGVAGDAASVWSTWGDKISDFFSA